MPGQVIKSMGAEPSTVRVSVTLPVDEYGDLKRLAEGNRVSVAWLVRDAVTRYLQDQAPLFGKTGTGIDRAPRLLRQVATRIGRDAQ